MACGSDSSARVAFLACKQTGKAGALSATTQAVVRGEFGENRIK